MAWRLMKQSPLNPISAKRRAALAAAGNPNPRSTLATGSPLTRKPALRTAAPVKPKRPRDTGPTEATVKLVWGRDGGCCSRCGLGLSPADRGDRWSVHHRALRSHGVDNSPANLILLCGGALADGCHRRVHGSPGRYRREGGWILRSTDDPARYPVVHALRGFVFLAADGSWAPSVTDGVAA